MVDKTIGRTQNTSDSASVNDGIALNGSTSVVIADANPKRIFFEVNNNFSDKAVWIKLQPADDDNDKKGIFLNEKEKGRTHWEMPPDNIYTGEISAIADSSNPTVYVTEY